MRLSELRPELDVRNENEAYISFDCPHCHMLPNGGETDTTTGARVVIKIAKQSAGDRVWTWNGETDLEKISITPSINMYDHWHGHVTNGEVTTVP